MNKSLLALIIAAPLAFSACGNNVEITEEPPARYYITLENLSVDQALGNGVFVLHNEKDLLDFEGEAAPESLASALTSGDSEAFEDYLRTIPEVTRVYGLKTTEPSDSRQMEVEPTAKYFSVIQFIDGTNYALVNSEDLKEGSHKSENLMIDGGEVDNSDLSDNFLEVNVAK